MMKTLKEIVTPLSVLILAGILLYDRMVPRPVAVPAPVPAVSGLALGKAYATDLLSTYGEAWLAAARSLEEGGSVADAQKALQDSWKEARVKAFADHVGSRFALVLPEGSEPASPEKRAQVVQLWRDFARGLQGDR
jgi:hypothetical protein